MKRVLFLFMFLGASSLSIAQSNVTIQGQLDNTAGAPVDVEIEVNDLGAIISQTLTTNSSGFFSTVVSVSAGATQGAVDLSFIDCNGAIQNYFGSFYPGNLTVDFGNVDYCPSGNPTGSTCDSYFTISQEYTGMNIPVPNSLIVSNNSTSTGTLTYSWDFGDGNTATGFNVSHTYSGPGPFVLCLTVDDGNGCTDTFCDSIGVNTQGLSLGKQAGFTVNITGGTASIDDGSQLTEMTVYPNPTSDEVNITMDELSETVDLKLIDLSGKIVHSSQVEPSSGTHTIKIDLSTFQKGIYTLNVTTELGSRNQRLIIK